jgi:dipeptidyl aminopeptidase/acylaminoacyl peptidase
LFTAAVLLNPVITALPAESDIPDWYFDEFMHAGPKQGDLEREQMPPEIYKALYAMSPISHIGTAQTPVRLLLGLSDTRVSNTHGMALYHALKAQRKEVDLLVFPGQGHVIDGVKEHWASYNAMLEWFAT